MTILDEAELKASLQEIYEKHGIFEVLKCIETLQMCLYVATKKFEELLKNENPGRD